MMGKQGEDAETVEVILQENYSGIHFYDSCLIARYLFQVILPDGFGASFSDKAIRQRFIRKVYMILLSQLAVTTAFISGIQPACILMGTFHLKSMRLISSQNYYHSVTNY